MFNNKRCKEERLPLLRTNGHSNRSSIANGALPADRTDLEGDTNWRYLGIAYFLMATSVVQFTMYFASLWPYLKEIDLPATTSFFGYIVAIYSVGQIISSPIFGWWSTKTKSTRGPILLSVLINIVANLIYLFAEIFPSPRRWVLFTARLLVGISAGNLGVLRAFVAEASATKDKISAISIGNMVITVGFIIGPGIQSIFAPIGYPGVRVGELHIDMYTTPSLFAIGLGLISSGVLLTCYREKYVGLRDKSEDPNSHLAIPHYDKLAATTCLWLWFVTLCYFTVSESISAPFTMVMYDWTRAEATQYVGVIYAVSGGISCAVYLVALYLRDRIDLRKAMTIGFAFMFLFYVISFPWPGLTGKLNFKQDMNTSDVDHLQLNTNRSYTEPVGCEPTFTWCNWTPKVPFAQYVVALICGAIGYPIATAYVSVLFTLVIGPRRQGTMQGIFTMVGSFARCFAPFFVSTTFDHFGPRTPWIVTGLLMFSSIALIIVSYRRLVPLDISCLDTFDKHKVEVEYAESFMSLE